MRIVFVYFGELKYKGRLLKQIKTLKEAGHECILVHGRTELETSNYENYDFRIVDIRLELSQNKIRNFFNQIRINFKASSITISLKPDYVICITLFAALTGVLVKNKQPIVQFAFDNNELFMQKGMSFVKKLAWMPIHSLVFLKADIIMHAEENRMEYCMGKYISSAKHVLLENLPFAKQNSIPKSRKELHDPIRIVYIGAFLPARCIEDILDAFHEIPSELASCDLIGYGKSSYMTFLKEYASSLSLDNVRFLPPVHHANMLKVLNNYDVGLALYRSSNLNQYYCAPNKVYDYITCDMPIIGSDNPSLINIIEKYEIGVCLSSISGQSMMRAIISIKENNLQDNITHDLKLRFSWEAQASKYIRIFSN
ncbi:MAG: glycosyltransferase [Candidatus Thorarchaeota archaeon]